MYAATDSYTAIEDIGLWEGVPSSSDGCTTQEAQVTVVDRQSSRRGYSIVQRSRRPSTPTSNVVNFHRASLASSTGDSPYASLHPRNRRFTWLADILPKLSAIAELPENWDTYGSPSVSRAVLGHAMRLLHQLDKLNFPEPEVIPSSGGGIQFEWEVNGQELELEILPDISMVFLLVDELGNEQEGDLSIESEESLLRLYRMLNLG